MNRCLFGGTLVAAGMLTATANADFNFQYSYALVAAGDITDQDPYDSANFVGPGFYSISASTGDAFSSIDATADCLLGSATSQEAGRFAGSGVFFSYFDVTSTGNVDVSWDFSGNHDFDGNIIPSQITIIDITNNVVLLAESIFSNVTGNVSIGMTAGNVYFIQAIAIGGDDAPGTSWYSMKVPAPASGGLLAIAGLVATRRRR